MTSSFSSRVAVSKILLKSTLECLFGWSYIILKLHDAARHWDLLLLWTPTAGEIICHFNLWCNHSKETSLRSSLIAIDRHWVLWTPTVGEIHCHLNLCRTVWCNHSKETSLVERLYSTVKPRLTDGHLVIITVSLLCPVHFQFNPPRTLGLFHAPRLSGSLNWRKRKHENKTGENWNKNWKLLPFSRPANFSCAFLFPFLPTS